MNRHAVAGALVVLGLVVGEARAACTSPPLFKGSVSVGGTAEDLAVSGPTVLVAADTGFLRVIDVSNPSSPVEIGSATDGSYRASALAINGSTAFVNGGSSSAHYLYSFDVSNPAVPTRLERISTGGTRNSLVFSSGLLFGSTNGVASYDVTNPSDMRQLGYTQDYGKTNYGLAYAGNRIWTGSGGDGIRVYDVSNPGNMVKEPVIDTPGEARGVAISGSILTIADGMAGGLRFYSIANPTSPSLLGSVDTPGNALSIALAGSSVAVVADYGTIQIVDFENASAPAIIGSATVPNGAAVAVAVSSDHRYAYVGDGSNLDIFDISGCTSSGGTAPTVNFTFSPASPTVGQTVSFTDASTGSPTGWSWSFGDGGTSTSQHPMHAYSAAGSYTVTLTATNSYGSSSISKAIVVSTAGGAPTADFTFTPSAPSAGQAVSFTNTSTGNPTSFAWNFGDGGTSTTVNPSHTYAASGTYTVTLTATNAYGNNSISKVIVVAGSGCTTAPSAPTLVYPSAGATGVETTNATFSWNAATCATSYDLTIFSGSSCSGTTIASLSSLTTTYGSVGSLPVSSSLSWKVTARNAIGSATSSCASFTTAGGGTPGTSTWIAAAAHASGAGGSFFKTSLTVVNRGTSAASVTVKLHTASAVKTWGTQTIPAKGQAIWDDIVAQVNGSTSNEVGSLEIVSASPLLVFSRTYNQSSTGSFGQSFEGLTAEDGLGAGETGYVGSLQDEGAFRANVGFLNMGTSTATISFALVDPSGVEIGNLPSLAIPAGRLVPVNRIFSYLGLGSGTGYLKVTVAAGSGIWAYGSVLDNATSDPTTIPMRK